MKQEPGNSQEIIEFARGKYKAEFILFEKVKVNGIEAHEVY